MQTEVVLPQWLDDYIFQELGAKYCRSNSDMTVIDWDKKDILNYLGTYFPRSYAESYCIFSEYFANNKEEWKDKTALSVFDFGCGTGGEIIGLLMSIKEQLPNVHNVYIKALDGNQHALRILEQIDDVLRKKININTKLSVAAIQIDDFYDLSVLDAVINKRYDIIMSFKAICEFVTKDQFEKNNPYKHIISVLLPKVEKNGILVLVDVTTYNKTSQEWLPKMMDKGLAEIMCNIVKQNNGYNQCFYVSHSQRKQDTSKVAWRIIEQQN